MELLETQDPEKKKFMEAANLHKRELENGLGLISERTEKIMTNALIIGGALALTYILVRQFSPSKRKKKKIKSVKLVTQASNEPENTEEEEDTDEGPSLISQISIKIANEATVLLLDIVKEKLSEYLQSRKPQQNENS